MRIDLPPGDGEDYERMWHLRPEFGRAVAAFGDAIQQNTILPVREHEAARIRIAHINGCIPCSEARIADMERYGLDDSFYEDVDDPTRRGRYTEREVLAIEFAERFEAGVEAFDNAFWDRMRAAYTSAEILDLAACCGKWMGLGRVNAVLELEVSCPIRIEPPRVLAEASAA